MRFLIFGRGGGMGMGMGDGMMRRVCEVIVSFLQFFLTCFFFKDG